MNEDSDKFFEIVSGNPEKNDSKKSFIDEWVEIELMYEPVIKKNPVEKAFRNYKNPLDE